MKWETLLNEDTCIIDRLGYL